MKRCLHGWIHSSHNFRSKLEASKVAKISQWMVESNNYCPSEFERANRSLNEMSFWKSIEFRNFLLYFGPVALRGILRQDMYEHFLYLSVSIRIVSCDIYVKNVLMRNIVNDMLIQYIETYMELYGADSINNNVHDLCHLMADVERFGSLKNISAYPFESTLYTIKNMLRSGSRPLAQVAKRMVEKQNYRAEKPHHLAFPVLKNQQPTSTEQDIFLKIVFESFLLASDNKNKWFLTKNDEVVGFDYVTGDGNNIQICGRRLTGLNDLFKKPCASHIIHIFETILKFDEPHMYKVSDVKCKMVRVKSHSDSFVFFPLIHTFMALET